MKYWEKEYSDIDAKTFGEASKEVLDLIPMLSPGCNILDLGCGDGRNAIPLARAKFNVTALDISESGVKKLDILAKREGLSINTSIEDMTTYKFKEVYDLIISHGCLHFIERNKWKEIINNIKTHTNQNGFNVVAVFTNKIPIPSDLVGLCVGLFNEDELYNNYSDWDVVLKSSYTFKDKHANGAEHTHAINKLVAKKTV